jgi:hypothetical protein
MASRRQTAIVVETAMLFGNDVFGRDGATDDVFGVGGSIRNAHQPVHRQVAAVRHPSLLSNSVQAPVRLQFEYRDEVRSVDQRSAHRIRRVVRTEVAVIGPFSQSIDPFEFPYWRIDSKFDETPRWFRIEAAAQRVQKAIQPGCSVHAFTPARHTHPIVGSATVCIIFGSRHRE